MAISEAPGAPRRPADPQLLDPAVSRPVDGAGGDAGVLDPPVTTRPGGRRLLDRPPPPAPSSGGPGAHGGTPGWWGRLAVTAVVAVVAAGVVLRFVTHSAMWLDEALTVDISRLPLGQIPAALKRDGAPPLFYVLLHFWMEAFGQGDEAVRSLSGLFSCATLPLVWVAGRRLGGRTAAVGTLLVVASSPFAIYYGTEARMYALVAFLVAAGAVALLRAVERPRPGNVVAVGVVTAALLYTHYWALYLVAVTGLWLLWTAWRGPEARRPAARWLCGAMVVGALAFVPWLPIFVFQARHTGTPWAEPASFAAMVNAVSSFAGGAVGETASGGRALALLLFALGGLGFFGLATGRLTIDLDLRGRPRARALGWVFVATIVLAIVGGAVSHSAFQARYAMVVFVPLMLLVGLGLTTLADPRVRAGVLAVAVLAGLAGDVANLGNTRTEAVRVAAVLDQLGRPGDVVAYCPDQLGPDTARLLPAGRYQQITFPRETGPQFVNWVDYSSVVHAGDPATFVRRVEQLAGSGHQIWFVWMSGYQGYGTKCQQIETDLLADPGLGAREVFAPQSKYYEPMELVRFVHVGG